MIQRLSDMNLPRFPLLSETEMMELLQKAKKGDINARETPGQLQFETHLQLNPAFRPQGI
jgi:hypothetical protein